MTSLSPLSRREVLGRAAGGAAAAALVGSPVSMAAAGGGAYRERNRVDLHCHHLPPAYIDALHNAGIFLIGGIPIPEWSPTTALGFMNGHGIRVQMLSISDPGVSFLADGGDAANLARTCNEYLAAIIEKHPGRFGGFAVVGDQFRDEISRPANSSRGRVRGHLGTAPRGTRSAARRIPIGPVSDLG